MTMTGAAAMTHGAVAILQAAMTISADDHTLTIDRRAAGAAGMGEATARRAVPVPVAVIGLAGGRGENGEAGGDSQEGDDLFHDGGVVSFDLLPLHERRDHQTRGISGYSTFTHLFFDACEGASKIASLVRPAGGDDVTMMP